MENILQEKRENIEKGKNVEIVLKLIRHGERDKVDNLVDLIEPAMIVLLGVGVGILLASVLIPIYNVAAAQ